MEPRPSAERYDAWYRTPRGAWIGETEFRLLERMLAPRPGETLLDIGCGTGYFTRRFASDAGLLAIGLDPDGEWLACARERSGGRPNFIKGRAEALPFPERGFDLTLSVTALCFVPDERRAIAEMLRVTRRRFAIGLLNRASLLYRRKAGHGAYAGAHWHTPAEARALFSGFDVRNLEIGSAVFLPGGGGPARLLERILPNRLPCGALLAIAGSVVS